MLMCACCNQFFYFLYRKFMQSLNITCLWFTLVFTHVRSFQQQLFVLFFVMYPATPVAEIMIKTLLHTKSWSNLFLLSPTLLQLGKFVVPVYFCLHYKSKIIELDLLNYYFSIILCPIMYCITFITVLRFSHFLLFVTLCYLLMCLLRSVFQNITMLESFQILYPVTTSVIQVVIFLNSAVAERFLFYPTDAFLSSLSRILLILFKFFIWQASNLVLFRSFSLFFWILLSSSVNFRIPAVLCWCVGWFE